MSHQAPRISIPSAIASGLIAVAIAACGGSKGGGTPVPSSPAAASATPSPTLSLTAADRKFIADMASQYSLGTGTPSSDTAVISTGDDICSMLRDGTSETDIAAATQSGRAGLTGTQAIGIIKLAGTELCPGALPKPFQSQTLLDVSGSGEYTTTKFTVGGSGDYDVDWTYSVGNDGPQVNFDFTADGDTDPNLTGPNQLGSGGSGVTHVYSDAGVHYLQINSEGDWTVKVTTEP